MAGVSQAFQFVQIPWAEKGHCNTTLGSMPPALFPGHILETEGGGSLLNEALEILAIDVSDTGMPP